jgi:predicted dehydrogenase
MRDELGFDVAAGDLGQLLADPRIRAVHVCTPNDLHAGQCSAILASGRSVYCDKPLALTVADADALASLARSSPATAQVAFQYRFLPATMCASGLRLEGRLGRLLAFRAVYLHAGSVDPSRPAAWRMRRERSGGGALMDLGVHAIDLLRHLTGEEFASVSASTRILHPVRPDGMGGTASVDVEDAAVMLARLSGGAEGTVEVSRIATGCQDELRIELHGDRGALRFDLMEPNWLDFYDQTLPEAPLGGERGWKRIECMQRYPAPGGSFPGPKTTLGWIRAHVDAIRAFAENVAAGRPGDPSFDDGAAAQRVVAAAYGSAEAGSWKPVHFPV